MIETVLQVKMPYHKGEGLQEVTLYKYISQKITKHKGTPHIVILIT